MGLDIDKTTDELKQNIQNIPVADDSVENFETSGNKLTPAENASLTYNLSGEAQSQGFTESDAEILANGLSGSLAVETTEFCLVQVNIKDDFKPNFNNENVVIKLKSDENNSKNEDTIKDENANYNNALLTSFNDNIYENETNQSFRDLFLCIKQVKSLDELYKIKDLINKISFSKAEKNILNNECIKQQGIIQNNLSSTNKLSKKENDNISDKVNNHEAKSCNFDFERQRSAASFTLSKFCNNSAQREFAKFILNDKRLFLLINKNTEKLFKELISSCVSNESAIAKIKFLNNALENGNFVNDSGVLNSNVLSCSVCITPDNVDKSLTILDNALNSDSSVNTELFCKLIKEPLEQSNQLEATIPAFKLIIEKADESDKIDKLPFKELIAESISNNSSYEDVSNAYTDLSEINSSNIVYDIVNNDFNKPENDSLVENVIYKAIVKDTELYKNFISGRQYDENLLNNLFQNAQKDYCKDLISELCVNQEYSAKNIVSIANLTTKTTIGLTRKVLNRNDVTADEKVNILSSINNSQDQIQLIESVLNKDDMNIKSLPKILKSAKILKLYEADRCSNLNPKKMDIYVNLLQNPKTSPKVIKLLKQGYDIESISNYKTSMLSKLLNKHNKIKSINESDKKFFMELGFEEKDADKIVKSLTNNSVISSEMKDVAIKLINSGLPKEEIVSILNSSTIDGNYNSKIVADGISIYNMGLNSFLERYLPIINNIPEDEFFTLYNIEFLKDLKSNIHIIPKYTIPALRAKGFDIDGINKKVSYALQKYKNKPTSKNNMRR